MCVHLRVSNCLSDCEQWPAQGRGSLGTDILYRDISWLHRKPRSIDRCPQRLNRCKTSPCYHPDVPLSHINFWQSLKECKYLLYSALMTWNITLCRLSHTLHTTTSVALPTRPVRSNKTAFRNIPMMTLHLVRARCLIKYVRLHGDIWKKRNDAHRWRSTTTLWSGTYWGFKYIRLCSSTARFSLCFGARRDTQFSTTALTLTFLQEPGKIRCSDSDFAALRSMHAGYRFKLWLEHTDTNEFMWAKHKPLNESEERTQNDSYLLSNDSECFAMIYKHAGCLYSSSSFLSFMCSLKCSPDIRISTTEATAKPFTKTKQGSLRELFSVEILCDSTCPLSFISRSHTLLLLLKHNNQWQAYLL